MRVPDSKDGDGVLKHDWEPIYMGQSTKPFKWVCKNCEYVAHQSPENYGDMSGYPTWNCALRMARLVMEA